MWNAVQVSSVVWNNGGKRKLIKYGDDRWASFFQQTKKWEKIRQTISLSWGPLKRDLSMRESLRPSRCDCQPRGRVVVRHYKAPESSWASVQKHHESILLHQAASLRVPNSALTGLLAANAPDFLRGACGEMARIISYRIRSILSLKELASLDDAQCTEDYRIYSIPFPRDRYSSNPSQHRDTVLAGE
jgi:hypothetical protein